MLESSHLINKYWPKNYKPSPERNQYYLFIATDEVKVKYFKFDVQIETCKY